MTKRKQKTEKFKLGLDTPARQKLLSPLLKDIDNAYVYGSDSKTKSDQGICILCMARSTLVKGHVIPRWVAKSIKNKDSEKKMFVLAAEEDADLRPYIIQDGFNHRLLCGECDNFLGYGEKYLSQISREARSQLTPTVFQLNKDYIDRDRLLRGLYGIAFKTHFAASSSFSITSPHLVGRLRVALENNRYNWLTPPQMAIVWKKSEEVDPLSYCHAQIVKDSEGLQSFILTAEGITWALPLYPLGSGPNPKTSLWSGGGISVGVMEHDSSPLLAQLKRVIQEMPQS